MLIHTFARYNHGYRIDAINQTQCTRIKEGCGDKGDE
jgi:predicted secreted protein